VEREMQQQAEKSILCAVKLVARVLEDGFNWYFKINNFILQLLIFVFLKKKGILRNAVKIIINFSGA